MANTMRIICDGSILAFPSGEQVDIERITGIRIFEAFELGPASSCNFPKRVAVDTMNGVIETEYTEESMAVACEAHRMAKQRAAEFIARIHLPAPRRAPARD